MSYSIEPNSKKARMTEIEEPALSAEQLDRFSRQNAALGKKHLKVDSKRVDECHLYSLDFTLLLCIVCVRCGAALCAGSV